MSLSEKIQYIDGRLKVEDVQEYLMKLVVWVTTKHAPDKSSDDVLQKAKELFGDELI